MEPGNEIFREMAAVDTKIEEMEKTLEDLRAKKVDVEKKIADIQVNKQELINQQTEIQDELGNSCHKLKELSDVEAVDIEVNDYHQVWAAGLFQQIYATDHRVRWIVSPNLDPSAKQMAIKLNVLQPDQN